MCVCILCCILYLLVANRVVVVVAAARIVGYPSDDHQHLQSISISFEFNLPGAGFHLSRDRFG